MIVGDLVKILHSANDYYEDLIGVIVRIIRPHKAKQYWVRICDKNMGPYPFSINQLEKM
jgi:hypothetical protein